MSGTHQYPACPPLRRKLPQAGAGPASGPPPNSTERPPNPVNVPPPRLRGRQRPNVRWGGGGTYVRAERPNVRWGGGGRGTSTLGRYVGNVRCRGPTFPFERAFTTAALVGPISSSILLFAGHGVLEGHNLLRAPPQATYTERLC